MISITMSPMDHRMCAIIKKYIVSRESLLFLIWWRIEKRDIESLMELR